MMDLEFVRKNLVTLLEKKDEIPPDGQGAYMTGWITTLLEWIEIQQQPKKVQS
jgi:hypothetical protein